MASYDMASNIYQSLAMGMLTESTEMEDKFKVRRCTLTPGCPRIDLLLIFLLLLLLHFLLLLLPPFLSRLLLFIRLLLLRLVPAVEAEK
jgi:hypothetical protein